MKITEKAPAKINLCLDLGDRFDDGYHAIFTIMHTVSLYDEVTVSAADDITIVCETPGVPTDRKNTCYKAAEEFFACTGIKGGAKIEIVKNIPSQAGLAGGSADAAAALRALNGLYGAGLGMSDLANIASKVGSDVPFCVYGGAMLSQNRGEVISALPRLPGCRVVLVKPPEGVSTAEAYAAYDARGDYRRTGRDWLLHTYMKGDLDAFFASSFNIFEQAVYVPGRARIKEIMRRSGSDCCLMTGSGSCVFGVFYKYPEKADDAVAQLKKEFDGVFAVEPV